jgi:glycosyltransferase involved in cell wall biosynthesis
MITDLVGWQRQHGHDAEVFSLSEEQSRKWSKFGHLPALAMLARRIPGLSGFDIVHAHGWASEAAFSKKPSAPVLATMYGAIAQYMQNIRLPAWRRAYLSLTQLRFEKNACAKADAVASLCRKQAEEMALHYGFPGARPINCGIDTKLFSPKGKEKAKERVGLSKHGKIVLACGRMSVAHKRFDILLKLAERLPDGCTLVVNGKVPQKLSGMMRHNMVATTTKMEDMPYLYSAADLLVHPSCYEGFGLVTAEAMACGTPAVAFDTGAASELIGKNEGGELVPGVADGEKFISAALSLVKGENEARRRGKEAHRRASAFTIEAMAQGYYDYYGEIISGGGTPCQKKR